ncbi:MULTISPECIES: ABC transporter permease [unclassified Solwaraspora]|uniref:ABC transporter permease n=1 Tax=unclassified Solwaraspora TaxID=2627926 RepID=UPI00248C2363|nr:MULTISPECIES: ABC transporter permease [unclassified Solwaraspora]WBB97342.1 ABC transporter permease [Solwaraspora sp. WMMA2059]WBC18756.1 ABC transporter permease [Solwaraspora sp. WMMA2080]WJK33838.1 ABC transporter permease [Solwaraspora sp. WMMA2065]
MAYDDSPYRRRNASTSDPTGHHPPGDTRYGDTRYGDTRYGDTRYGDTRYPAAEPGRRGPAGYSTSSFSTVADFSTAGGSITADSAATGNSSAAADQATRNSATTRHSRRRRASTALDDVFDDPYHGERGRDRLGVHFIWELILLLVVGGIGYLLYRVDPGLTTAGTRDPLLVYATGLGLFALAAGVTLRAGAPNLAIGPVAVAAALHFAENGDNGVVPVLVTGIIWAVVLGAGTALLVAGLQVPGWAGSLVAACVAVVFIQQRSGPVDLQGAFDPTGQAFVLFGGFVVLALLGGSLGTIKSIRRGVGRFRPVADPADRRGGVAALVTSGALILSMVFAVVGGVLLAAVGNGPVSPSVGLEWTAVAIGAALLGGTSVFGRRGGVFGTVLAVIGLTLFIRYAELRDLDIALYATGAVAVVVGLTVTRLVETFGRPRSTSVDDAGEAQEAEQTAGESAGESEPVHYDGRPADWPEHAQAGSGWPSDPPTGGQQSWSASLPAQPAPARDRWDTSDSWGADDQWGTDSR